MIATERELARTNGRVGPPDASASTAEREARERLVAAGYLSLRDVTCEVAGGVARLAGRLPSQYLRQVAHAVVDGVEGVRSVLNQIEVVRRPARTTTLLAAADGQRGGRAIAATRPGLDPTRILQQEVGAMLVLSRKTNESIHIGDDIRIKVVAIQGNTVRLGIEAPDSVGIYREEIYVRVGPPRRREAARGRERHRTAEVLHREAPGCRRRPGRPSAPHPEPKLNLPEGAPTMLRSILIGLDGSEDGDAALELGLRWAKEHGALAAGVAVADEPGIHASQAALFAGAYSQPAAQTLVQAEHRRAAHVLSGFALRCDEAFVRYKVIEVTGSPGYQILTEAQRFDLVVLGRHTHFGYGRETRDDDTLTTVLKESPRPVVVAPRDAVGGAAAVVAFDGSLQAARAALRLRGVGAGAVASGPRRQCR